ncbi:AAA family ATPase [Burkholderia orbicola]|uniref:AAA family ATPase n=1 Tax=Burkholderia orbicola TaxID=2978683 RepID=UPI002650914E|nr:AAA family ATPase [Burkholderia orbicola]MDN7558129.1 AAA family ATPase [Burkholderia orbicola]
MMNGHDGARAREALFALDAGCAREEWVRVAMAAKAAGLPEDDFLDWSATGANYGSERDARSVWKSVKPDGGIGPGTLFKMAKDAGWNGAPCALVSSHAVTAQPGAQAAPKPHFDVAAAFASYPPASADHPYIVAKRGNPAALRVVPFDDPQTVAGKSVCGYLVVPAYSLDGQLRTVQYVPPPGQGKKLNAPGASFGNDGFFAVGEIVPDGTLYVVEGIGQAWACAKADYQAAAAVAFGAGRIGTVAKSLRKRYPAARIVIVPDKGKEQDAESIAREIGGAWVEMPADKPSNYDANDFEAEHGSESLADLLRSARTPKIELLLKIAFADELPDRYEPPDELVQGVLTVGGGSVVYGDTNCGKTFFVIDMAIAVARGVPFMGRQTEQGLVLYLAVESPASVCARVQAYQKYHGVLVPNFGIVQSTVNLFEGDDDANAIIETVRQLETQRGQKVRLIVGDTLARISAGANENAGQDMGRVIERFDRIRTECQAHFTLVHHCGKNAAYGMRGWSGIRAAIDSEIELTDAVTGRCAEITKQRDLGTKGERIGFLLDVVPLGITKWGAPATSCVVVPTDAPPPDKVRAKRVGEVEGAVAEFLAARKTGIRKSDVVHHFAARYPSSSVYRAMKTLVGAGAAHEAAGMICVAVAVK